MGYERGDRGRTGRLCLPAAAVALAACLLAAGCGKAAAQTPPERTVRIVLEEGEGYRADAWCREAPAGSDITFLLTPEEGYTVTGCDSPGAVLSPTVSGVELLLPHVMYTEMVRPRAVRDGISVTCTGAGEDGEGVFEMTAAPTHLRINAPAGTAVQRRGFTLAGWRTGEAGGRLVSPGSRFDPGQARKLHARWEAWSAEEDFTWEPSGDGAAITGYSGSDDLLVVPGELSGLPVREIRKGAFAGAQAETVILPMGLWTIEDGAFSGAALSEVFLWDDLRKVSDYAFEGCGNLRTLRIGAAVSPVYPGTYYASFPDKMDRLMSLRREPKIILFSGSSTRFGYDCALLDDAFPDYAVCNMGVFAYTNALPQFDLIRLFSGPGDVLVHTPEFDAAQRQFCASENLDAAFFRMIEGDYDLLSLLDIRDYGQVFTALQAFLYERQGMPGRSFDLSPADFDEEGAGSPEKTYNAYGDYCLYRPEAASEEPVYGLPVDYTKAAFPAAFLDALNGVYGRFLEKGVRVFFAYAPRNERAVSERTDAASLRELDEYFSDGLCVPVLGTAGESLMSGRWFFGTDNHLCTEGAVLRTKTLIGQLREVLP